MLVWRVGVGDAIITPCWWRVGVGDAIITPCWWRVGVGVANITPWWCASVMLLLHRAGGV